MFWLIFVCISYHLCPQFWHTRMDLWCCFSFCFFGAKILTISAGMVKHSHQIGNHHQPIHSHQTTPWCLSFISVSVTICTFTFSLPQTGHFILFASYFLFLVYPLTIFIIHHVSLFVNNFFLKFYNYFEKKKAPPFGRVFFIGAFPAYPSPYKRCFSLAEWIGRIFLPTVRRLYR